MASDPITIFELYQDTLRKITASTKAWADFLRAAGNLYKYPFSEQVLIYAQRPDATACATYDIWIERLHRYVAHGSKGIALIDDTAPALKLKYVFDVADTRSLQKDAQAPHLWAMEHKHRHWIINSLSSTFGLNLHDYRTADDVLSAVIRNLVEESLEQSLPEFYAYSTDSLWDELDEHSIRTFYRDALGASATWSIMLRCGLDPNDYVALQEFCHVLDCNTASTITCFGVTVNSVVGKVLRHVERTIKDYELDEIRLDQMLTKGRKRSQNRLKERSTEHGTDLQNGGQAPNSRGDNTRESDELREIRPSALELSPEGATGDIHRSDDAGQAHGASNGDRQVG